MADGMTKLTFSLKVLQQALGFKAASHDMHVPLQDSEP